MLLNDSKVTLVQTKDESKSLVFTPTGETYHSHWGAVTESQHVFINNGLSLFTNKSSIDLLEIGVGTGLNLCLAAKWALNSKSKLNYTGVEAYPISLSVLQQLHFGESIHQQHIWEAWLYNYTSFLNLNEIYFQNVNASLMLQPLQEINFYSQFDLVFYDAFSPTHAPEMWTEEVLLKVYNALKHQGVIVTYCARGYVRRTFQAFGAQVNRLPGPPGKREMLQIIKI